MRISNELQKGKAGEYLVCADLILKGFIAFISEQGLPYDIILDTGKKLFKVQVKTTEILRKVPQRNKDTLCYIFNIKRHGKIRQNIYSENEVDLFALVCLDTRKIMYLKNGEMPETINVRADELKGTYYDEVGIEVYQQAKELQENGLSSYSEIARRLNKDVAYIHRILKLDFKPYITNARYVSDLMRDSDWFLNL